MVHAAAHAETLTARTLEPRVMQGRESRLGGEPFVRSRCAALAMAATSKAAAIQTLIGQLKSGSITRDELMARLREMKQGGSGSSGVVMAPGGGAPAYAAPTASSAHAATASAPLRAAMVR